MLAEDVVDAVDQLGLDEVHFGIWKAKIVEDDATAVLHGRVGGFHGSSPHEARDDIALRVLDYGGKRSFWTGDGIDVWSTEWLQQALAENTVWRLLWSAMAAPTWQCHPGCDLYRSVRLVMKRLCQLRFDHFINEPHLNFTLEN